MPPRVNRKKRVLQEKLPVIHEQQESEIVSLKAGPAHFELLSKLLEDSANGPKNNVLITCDDGQLPVNSLLIKQTSPFIRNLLEDAEDTTERAGIHLDGVKLRNLRQVFELMYTGTCNDVVESDHSPLLMLMITLQMTVNKVEIKLNSAVKDLKRKRTTPSKKVEVKAEAEINVREKVKAIRKKRNHNSPEENGNTVSKIKCSKGRLRKWELANILEETPDNVLAEKMIQDPTLEIIPKKRSKGRPRKTIVKMETSIIKEEIEEFSITTVKLEPEKNEPESSQRYGGQTMFRNIVYNHYSIDGNARRGILIPARIDPNA